MFAYPDAARYRLGANYQQLPCNRPVSEVYSPYQRDGFMNTTNNYGSDPNYVRSALRPVNFSGSKYGMIGFAVGGHQQWVSGAIAGYTSEVIDEDFEQARMFWDVLARQPGQQDNLALNVAAHLGKALPEVQKETISKQNT